MNNQEPLKPELSDWGTRYEHLQDHLESLEACVEALKGRIYSADDKARLIKISAAADVMRATIDSYADINDTVSEYKLYRMLNGIPKDPAEIEGGRGTPLV